MAENTTALDKEIEKVIKKATAGMKVKRGEGALSRIQREAGEERSRRAGLAAEEKKRRSEAAAAPGEESKIPWFKDEYDRALRYFRMAEDGGNKEKNKYLTTAYVRFKSIYDKIPPELKSVRSRLARDISRMEKAYGFVNGKLPPMKPEVPIVVKKESVKIEPKSAGSKAIQKAKSLVESALNGVVNKMSKLIVPDVQAPADKEKIKEYVNRELKKAGYEELE